jgi:hypothetical protein
MLLTPTLITESPLIKSMNLEALILESVGKGVGSLIVLSSNSLMGKVVKIYSVMETDNENEYLVGFELFDNVFEDEKYAQEFIEYLPSMSAIELMYVIYDLNDKVAKH